MKNDFKAAIFDLDGTLLYTLQDLGDSMNQVLQEEGLPVHNSEAYRFFVGNGMEMLVVRSLPKGLRRPEFVQPLTKKLLRIYQERQFSSTRPYDGVSELLDKLTSLKIGLAVLSNKEHQDTQKVVEHYFPGLFQIVLGRRDGVPAKPDPAGALEIMRDFNLPPERFVYLGDSDVDMKTAARAEMFAVGAAWGYRPEEELLQAGAQKIIHSPVELITLFVPGKP